MQIQVLAARLNLIKPDEEQEEYILTPDEEQEIISTAINNAKKHFFHTHSNYGESKLSIEKKISEIDWEGQIDKQNLFTVCNSNKQQILWHKSQRDKEEKEKKDRLINLEKSHSARFIFNLMAWTSENVFRKKLIVNDDTKKLITAICFFISKDERFEKELGYSFKKGLFIRGVSGLGKTYLFECIKNNEFTPVSICSMLEITERIQKEGSFDFPLMQNERSCLYLDDVGTEEPVVNYYGTKIHFFKNFIENYYLKNKVYDKLIISTNIDFDTVEKNYGFRVRSRVKDMFNIIDVSGKDLRGNV